MNKKGKIINRIINGLLILGCLTVLFPLYMTVIIAFKQPSEMTNDVAGALALPSSWNLNNFKEAMEVTDFWNSLGNSILITAVTVILCILLHSFAGYLIGRKMSLGKKPFKAVYYYIVSGMFGREKIHYIAPSPDRVEEEMEKFLTWFDGEESESSVIRSAIAHFRFVSIHPFEDGNGRLARILSDMLLARGEKSEFRFYNVSSQINKDKNHYYDILERMQHGDGDITEWLVWYMQKLVDALDEADAIVTTILNKSFFWQKASSVPMTERQTQMLNLFLDGYESKITSKSWATLAKCSKDTAIRDIQDLVDKNILKEDIPGAKRPSYSIVYDAEDLTQFFTEVSITEENGIPYLNALYKGKKTICERILRLDADRYQKGDLPLSNLLSKYCSYIVVSNKE